MGQSHRAGRQEAARSRRRKRQLLQVSGVVAGLAIVMALVMVAFTGDNDEPPTVAEISDVASNATWEAEAFTGGPRLAVDRTTHDEGDVAYGHLVSASFHLRNVGDEPLTLDDARVNTLEGC